MTTTTYDDQPSVLDRPLHMALEITWEKVIYGVLIIAGFVTRFYDLGARVMSHDESLHTQFAWYLYQGRGFQHSPMMHGPLRFEVTALSYWLFGDSDFTARILPALFGVAAIALMWLFRRWLGRAGALIAATMMLISPYMLYYSRYIRDEPFVIVWGLLLAYCVIRYMETRAPKFLYGLTAVTALFYATMETSFIYIAITMLFLGLHVVRELFAVRWPKEENRQPFKIAFVVTLTATLLGVAFFFYGRTDGGGGTETAEPVNPDEVATTTSTATSPYLPVAAGAGAIVAVSLLAGAYFVFTAFGNEMRRFPVLDLLIVFGIFVLPQLAAFPVRALGRDPIDYNLPAGTDIGAILNSNAGFTALTVIVLLAIGGAIGYWWDIRKFVITTAIFYGIYIPLYTTFFTNGTGLATGIVGSLGYWLVQQGVKRGNQPWYFYPTLHLTLYEFLPTLGALFAGGLWLYRWLKAGRLTEELAEYGSGVAMPENQSEAEADQASASKRRKRAPISPADTLGFPVIGYFGFWAVLALTGFTIAGEKMPWLTTHIALPLILVSGWGLGQFVEETDWQKFRERRAWLVALLLPLTVVAVATTLGSLLGDKPPFQGNTLEQIQATGTFISALIVAIIGGGAIYQLGKEMEWANVGRLATLTVFGLLGLLTLRTAIIATYINYDSANEFLVYAHGARGVKTVLEQLEELSERTTDGMGLKVAYDDAVSWPMTWYLRDFKNQSFYGASPTREALDAPAVIAGPSHWSKVESLLGNRYYKFEYIRMVWPMQDYFPQNDPATNTEIPLLARIVKLFSTAESRQAVWDIWFNRNYEKYGKMTSQNFDLSQWPVSERMRFYVRKDIAAQIWAYGVGPTVLTNTPAEETYKNKQDIPASKVWGAKGNAQGQFDAPRGIAIAPDGSLYVADSRNHRIQKFDAQGNFVSAFGSLGEVENNTGDPGKFKEPWAVVAGPDGSIYVVDTWNHRLQKFSASGQPLKTWGHFGQAENFDAMWGPRAIAVDAEGRLFVADTGNKRIVVFDKDGNGLQSIGGAGSDPGLFDEPVGLAIDPKDGTLYVADTWNQRIQVLQKNAVGEYTFLREWHIEGWYGTSLDNKPYIALDSKGRVYVTDPEGYRVLVFEKDGKFIITWGDVGVGNNQFGLAAGIAVGPDDVVYVTDAGENNRVMLFPAVK